MADQTLEQIRKIRLEKVNKLRGLGIDPYPSKVNGNPEPITTALESLGLEKEIAGRIMGWREHGNVIFADLKDESGQIQLWFQKNELEDKFKLLKYLDVGDFLFAKGEVTKTKAGEITINVKSFQILAKSILPLPSTFYGLKDVEERYRKRYLDMILNEGVSEKLVMRSKIVSEMRNYLNGRGFLEVETPTLQPVYGGGFAKPFKTHHNALDSDFYLRISDEMYLKRLIVGGFQKVYEITKVFRNEGIDFDHNPEFTMFEAQIAFEDYSYGMDLLEQIAEEIATKVLGKHEIEYQGTILSFKRPWKRMKVVESINEYAGVDPLKWNTVDEAKKAVQKLDIKPEKLKSLDTMRKIGEVIAFTFEECVEEKLIQPTIIYDYPIEVSPLSKKCDDPRFTQRFEMFAAGTELGNNYSELNDPVDLKQRFIEEKEREKAGFEEAHQTDYDYLIAIEHGFPPTCGVAFGVDRLVMLFTDAPSLKEIIPFPTLKPESQQTRTTHFGKEIESEKELPDEGEYKFYAVIRKDIEIGRAMNALGHASVGLGGGSRYADKMWFLKYQDKEGGVHPNISHYNYVVLKADSSEVIRKVRSDAIKNGVLYADFTSTMTLGKSIDQMKATKDTPEGKLDYFGVVMFGKTKDIKGFTNGLPLFD